MKRKQHYGKTILMGILLSNPLLAMDVATYFDVDIKAMQISVKSSQKVLLLLQSGASLEEQYTIIDETQEKLRKLFTSVDSTPSKHAGYYMKHQKEVKDFYENNSTLKEQYLQLEEKLENINKTIQTIREAK
jgi:hypothetical protein